MEVKQNQGGRPRIRTGTEVQITVEFPLQDYATLAGWVEYRKSLARMNRTPVSAESKKAILLKLWRSHWEHLSANEKNSAKAHAR